MSPFLFILAWLYCQGQGAGWGVFSQRVGGPRVRTMGLEESQGKCPVSCHLTRRAKRSDCSSLGVGGISFIFSLSFHLVFSCNSLLNCSVFSSLSGNFKPGVYAVSVTGRLPQGNNNHSNGRCSFTVSSSMEVSYVN